MAEIQITASNVEGMEDFEKRYAGVMGEMEVDRKNVFCQLS